MFPAPVLLCAFALSLPPGTQQIDHTAVVEFAGAHGGAAVVLPRFDPALGELVRVEVTITAAIDGVFGVENVEPDPTLAEVSLLGRALVLLPGMEALTVPIEGTASRFLGSFDGARDYAGTSGWRFPVQCQDQRVHELAGELSPFVATGSLASLVVPIGARAAITCDQEGVARRCAVATRIVLHVSYVYVPGGES